jgi:hypothetical protein
VGAPGMAPPGMPNAPPQQAGRGAGIPPNFQPPPGMNFNAPVIRLGTSGPAGQGPQAGRTGGNAEPVSAGGGRRLGLGSGMDQRGPMTRDGGMNLAPPTKEEIARTIFIGNITEGVGGDEGLERILRCAGGLRRWTRCTDADNKPCKFGFAEYEDAESLETAAEIFQDVKVPVKRPGSKSKGDNRKDANGDVKMQNGNAESEEADEDAKMEESIVMTTLLVSPAMCEVYVASTDLDIHRLSSMMPLRNTQRSGKHDAMRHLKRCSSALTQPKKPLKASLPA